MKSVKVLACVAGIVALALASGLILTGWTVLAQESTANPAGNRAQPARQPANVPGGDDPSAFMTPAERATYDAMRVKKLQEFSGHVELAEYMRLRRLALDDWMPPPEEDIAHYALMSIGQPYERKARGYDIEKSDCVTFTERCIALACTGDMRQAYVLTNRLRYKDGVLKHVNLNREPIFDWIPNNAWLFYEITQEIGGVLVPYLAVFEDRYLETSYLDKASLPEFADNLATGDIVFIIAETASPPEDPVVRLRCVHMGIIDPGKKTIYILQSYPPVATKFRLDTLLNNPYMRGCKFARLRPDARQIVQDEFVRLQPRFSTTPEFIDEQARLRKGEFGFTRASREAEDTIVVGDIEYGVITIKPEETLWRLFGAGYKGVCNLQINRDFMARQPDLDANKYAGETIYYPMRRVGH